MIAFFHFFRRGGHRPPEPGSSASRVVGGQWPPLRKSLRIVLPFLIYPRRGFLNSSLRTPNFAKDCYSCAIICAPSNSMCRGSTCQFFSVMAGSFCSSIPLSPLFRVMHSRVGPAPLRQKAAPVVRIRA